MSDGTLLLILLIPAVLAFAFGIWVGLGYPGMYDKYEKTGRVSRESPLAWLLRGGRRRLRTEIEREQDLEKEPEDNSRTETRPRFDRGRRIPR